MVSYVPDACISRVLEDNRLPKQLEVLKESVHAEVQWLWSLAKPVWQALAQICGTSSQALHSDVVSASHIAVGFLTDRIFREAARSPWCLAIGDRQANLASLLAGEEPSEPVACKIYRLLQLGFNRAQLDAALRLLAEVPWSTASVEQQHASATLVKRAHPDYLAETLVLRAMVHSLRLLLPHSSADERQLKRALATKARLEGKRPQGLTGRQLYLKELLEMVAERKEAGKSFPANITQTLFQKHGGRWAQLPDAMKAQFEARAGLARSKSVEQLAGDIQEADAKVAVMEERIKEQARQ
eukprot:5545857-Alexandrium_andersonii.AAC.1